MLVFGLISPHPPILIPEIGKDYQLQITSTITQLEQASIELGNSRPDELIIISPHEDHGFEVPLYYVTPHLSQNIEIKRILVTEPSYNYYYELGRKRGAEIAASPRRTAIVASGDLSHALKSENGYVFNAAGPVLDELIVGSVRDHNDQALLAMDPATRENGAECGLRSMLFLLGAVADTQLERKVLSYEGPFGVGYMVATFEPQAAAA